LIGFVNRDFLGTGKELILKKQCSPGRTRRRGQAQLTGLVCSQSIIQKEKNDFANGDVNLISNRLYIFFQALRKTVCGLDCQRGFCRSSFGCFFALRNPEFGKAWFSQAAAVAVAAKPMLERPFSGNSVIFWDLGCGLTVSSLF
jgi:hypothetical protein